MNVFLVLTIYSSNITSTTPLWNGKILLFMELFITLLFIFHFFKKKEILYTTSTDICSLSKFSNFENWIILHFCCTQVFKKCIKNKGDRRRLSLPRMKRLFVSLSPPLSFIHKQFIFFWCCINAKIMVPRRRKITNDFMRMDFDTGFIWV